jgi:hypothetical protein
MRTEFTIKDALDVQLEDISKWSKVLNADAYVLLSKEVRRRNAEGYDSPYMVTRGCDLTQIVMDIMYDRIKDETNTPIVMNIGFGNS